MSDVERSKRATIGYKWEIEGFFVCCEEINRIRIEQNDLFDLCRTVFHLLMRSRHIALPFPTFTVLLAHSGGRKEVDQLNYFTPGNLPSIRGKL